ncbi:MAG: 50S ribosomal protein L11 methyltransferase, partial [Kangiellaceae bacterium]|nr:50S ribosomal protein L11 methyltransferase [Kangiellaceae bacterium]
MSYTEVCFTVEPREIGQQILVAQLGELDFESFSEEDNVLKAYIKTELFNLDDVKACQIFENEAFSVTFSSKDLPDQNWNQTWEDNFKPVIISEQCVIRAPFHEPFHVDFEIVIEPKMSFGTGH